MIKNILLTITSIISIVFISLLVWANWSVEDLSQNQDEVIDEKASSDLCINDDEIETFTEPRPIVWDSRFDGCLVSCYGGSFTRIEDSVRFAAYYPDENGKYNYENNAGAIIPEEFRTGDSIRIYGNWLGIEADHPHTVFESKCVPFVEIKKIEKI
jgi:hypothetical protein